jgi:hypothetical protein
VARSGPVSVERATSCNSTVTQAGEILGTMRVVRDAPTASEALAAVRRYTHHIPAISNGITNQALRAMLDGEWVTMSWSGQRPHWRTTGARDLHLLATPVNAAWRAQPRVRTRPPAHSCIVTATRLDSCSSSEACRPGGGRESATDPRLLPSDERVGEVARALPAGYLAAVTARL